MKSFPWRFAAYFLAGLYLFADLYACHGPLRRRLLQGGRSGIESGGGSIAEVYGRPVTLLELQEAMRAHLWRRNEDWDKLGDLAKSQTRWLVAENLINERIVQAFRVMNGLDQPPGPAAAEREAETWARQFEDPSKRTERLHWQQVDGAQWRDRITASQEAEAWIAERIAHRVAEVTPAEIRRWHDANRESIEIPPSFRASHIFLTRHDAAKPDRAAEIRAIHRSLVTGGAGFAELAERHSEDERTRRRGGDLHWFTATRMPEDFIAAVSQLKPGQTSSPVLTQLGWHIIRLDERRPARHPPFEEVAAEIEAMLLSQRREAAVKSLLAELRYRSRKPTQFVFYHPEVIERALPAE